MKNGIKVLVMDVDGTLTDGKLNIGQQGELFKSFYCRDGLGILNAQEQGVIPVILTSRASEIVVNRASEIGIEFVLQGAKNNKKLILEEFLKNNNIDFNEVAYIGDDINDLECMKYCCVVGCPSDSVESVKQIANYICSNKGGNGAVREFIDWLLEN